MSESNGGNIIIIRCVNNPYTITIRVKIGKKINVVGFFFFFPPAQFFRLGRGVRGNNNGAGADTAKSPTAKSPVTLSTEPKTLTAAADAQQPPDV